jgi:type IV secretory pathway VirB10-like protein
MSQPTFTPSSPHASTPEASPTASSSSSSTVFVEGREPSSLQASKPEGLPTAQSNSPPSAPSTTPPPSAPGAVRDRRVTPPGVLPRRVQAWIMVGTAVVILFIILIAGRQQPLAPRLAGPRVDDAVPVPPALVHRYAQQLNANDQRQEVKRGLDEEQAQQAMQQNALRNSHGSVPSNLQTSRPSSLPDSLFADNVVLSRRSAADQPSAGQRPAPGTTDAARPFLPLPAAAASFAPNAQVAQLAQLEQAFAALAASGRAGATPAPVPAEEPLTQATPAPQHALVSAPSLAHRPSPTSAVDHKAEETPADGKRLRLLEGTVIETVLLTRLNGTLAGPVTCLVTTPVYSEDRQHVLIPAGARVLGASAPVQTWGDSRLAVSFHRLLMPDGHTYSLDAFRGLDQVGEAGVTEDVNRHYLQVFGASLAIGALSGLAQFGTTSGLSTTSFGGQYRQAAGASLASSTSRVLDRYLNVLPTITIREGYRIKVYLTSDFALPTYAPASDSGGIR